MNENVIAFVKKFTDNAPKDKLEGSYWFAFVLHREFQDSKIKYDVTNDHFGTEINNRIYDISGDVTDFYDWTDWERSFT